MFLIKLTFSPSNRQVWMCKTATESDKWPSIQYVRIEGEGGPKTANFTDKKY